MMQHTISIADALDAGACDIGVQVYADGRKWVTVRTALSDAERSSQSGNVDYKYILATIIHKFELIDGLVYFLRVMNYEGHIASWMLDEAIHFKSSRRILSIRYIVDYLQLGNRYREHSASINDWIYTTILEKYPLKSATVALKEVTE